MTAKPGPSKKQKGRSKTSKDKAKQTAKAWFLSEQKKEKMNQPTPEW